MPRTPARRLLSSAAAWKIVADEPFASHGRIAFVPRPDASDLRLALAAGDPGTGVNYRGPLPRIHYTVTAEARRVDGQDFFYGLTFPIGDQHASLIIGGWGGGVYGVSNLDGLSAVENETTGYVAFENDRWYRIELNVTEPRTTVTLDGEKIIDFETAAHQYAVWPEQATMIPLGIATWNTAAEIRGLELTGG
jgi:hypothetical protein